MPVYNHTLSANTQSQHFDKLEPFRNYTVSVTVISGDKKGAAVQNSTFTMIDRKLHRAKHKHGFIKPRVKSIFASFFNKKYNNCLVICIKDSE